VPVQSFDSTGLRFEDEIDCWPRSVALEFEANNQVTRTRLNWVRQRWGWNPAIFNLTITLDDGALVVSGADERSLPGGSYWFVLQVNSLIARGGSKFVSVDDDETTVTVNVAEGSAPCRALPYYDVKKS
jgi:hypothetical protein